MPNLCGNDRLNKTLNRRENENMATERVNDLRAFITFVDEKLSDSEANLTLDDALGSVESLQCNLHRIKGFINECFQRGG